MASNSKRLEKNAKTKKSDIIFVKLSVVFFLTCALIMFIMKLSYGGSQNNLGLSFWRLCDNKVYLGILGGLFVLSVAFFLYRKFIQKIDESMSYFASINLVALFGYALGASVFYRYIDNPHKPLLITTIAIIVLYYIYYIYQRDFFAFSSANLAFCLFLWLFAAKIGTTFLLVKIALVIAAAALCVYLARYAAASNEKRKNYDTKKGKKITLRTFTIWPVIVSTVIFAALLFSVSYFALNSVQIMLVMLIQFILAGIFYTIKLVREV